MYQLIASAAHGVHAPVRHLQDLPEHGTHGIAVKAQLAALAVHAGGKAPQPLQPLPAPIATGKGQPCFRGPLQYLPVVQQQGLHFRSILAAAGQGRVLFVPLLLQPDKIGRFLSRQALPLLPELLALVQKRSFPVADAFLLLPQPGGRVLLPRRG